MRTPHTVRRSLSYHNLTDVGMLELAAALRVCTSLVHVNLIGCDKATIKGYRAIISAIDGGACPALESCSLVFIHSYGSIDSDALRWKVAVKDELDAVIRKRRLSDPQQEEGDDNDDNDDE